MNTLRQINRVFLLLSALCCAHVALADDLEIYLGTSGSQVTYNPNVLFIMDTSGSMTGRDDGSQSRMLRVQNALKETLSSVTNINAGLMRFSDYGGPVLYPVRPIDDAVRPEIITSISQGSDDAFEISSSVTVGANTLKLSESTTPVTVGIRYQNLNIPRGATITSAFVRFTSNNYNVASTEFTISGELVGNASEFSNTASNITSRAKTANSVLWNTDNDWPVSNETISTPDITSIIQEIVDQSTWCGGNALSLLIEGVGSSSSSARQAKAYEEGSGLSPQLVITYDDTTATGCVKGGYTYQVSSQRYNAEERSNGYESTGSELGFSSGSNDYVGVIFRNVALPRNAAISNAYLEFTAYQTSSSSYASMNIYGANVNDVGNFNNYDRYELRNIAKTAAVNWADIPRWYRNYTYQSPAVTNIVQQIVNRSGWNAGNEMMFIMADFNGTRGAYSYNGQPSGAVKLVIEFEGQATPGQTSTVRDHLISQVDSLSAEGFTPIVDTLYEAANYYAGFNVDYGLKRGDSSTSSSVRRNTRVSSRLSYIGADSVLPSGCTLDNLSSSSCVGEYIPSGAQYVSPITDRQCQTNNHIVLLSDGEANNNHSVSKIESMLGLSCRGSGGEKCGLDLIRNIGDADESVIDSKIYTHTIGFAANSTANAFLNDLAINGNGGFYTASNTEDLVDVFASILKTVKDVNATFVSPGVAVNQLNRLTHNDELYFALFKPAEGTLWPGNVKKYKLDGADILDKNGNNAVDSLTGFFSDNAHSYWSVLADGNDVRDGGAASQMGLPRNVYAFSGPGTIMTTANLVHEDNNNFTVSDLALGSVANSSTVRETLLKWARGVDVRDDDGDGLDTDARLQMGDPIHSQPVIVNYSLTESAVLVATNHGYLHSFDPETGTENFAIMPKELMENLYDFYRDSSTFTHIYGLDGDMVLRSVGNNKYLYLGMRRGGKNYYALDVSNKTSPSLLFKIEGGAGEFAKLGQTWSKPTVTKIRVGSTAKNVLIFGGGYDADQDSKLTRSADSTGNAVFIVDADSGALIWSASNSDANLNLSDMQYSIPARVSVIDRDNDGFADHMYVVDMGGQLFRLDIHNGEAISDLVTGGLMADFGGDSNTDNRRFYYGPDVTEISLGAEHYYAVALGSGYRAHPLNSEIEDHFYMIKDTGVFTFDEDGNYSLPSPVLSISSLYDATDHLLSSSDSTLQQIEANNFAQLSGWMIRLGAGGEKVLASPLILDYQIIFTTYLPATASTSSCAPPSGNSRAYLVELVNGNAVTDLNQDGEQQHQDRYAQLKQTGIAPDTKILIEDIIKPIVCLGTECASTVIQRDSNGDQIACNSDFECLAENIYSNFERVQKSSWKTEIERQ
ncbi:PilC/PilY family type IV pilus protein [Paraglaciecola sp.]|uniref:PilC/PilY family type IV pilus protein n=1 Tax=Paraglaciecola sp. TaxID=1920173 RepID=UPI00273D797F|nr:PilC/PilY family type IV pilus protein [Paraglaciecola sp.]MDP5031477.1 PilC/PilY family type IV pilus protein [Paraglaciecola sp.]